MNQDLIIHRLTQENRALAKALGQSTAARGKQTDRIAALENENDVLRRENADLRRQVDELLGLRRVLLTLTDRGDYADYADGCGYDVGAVWVRELEAAG